MRDGAAATEPVRSLGAAVYCDLIRINRALRARSRRGALATGSVSALWTIVQHAPIRTTDLADREHVAVATVSRIVAGLEKQGMIRRSVDPHDGRAWLILPTEAGTEYIHDVTSGKAQFLELALRNLDADRGVELERCFALLADTLTSMD